MGRRCYDQHDSCHGQDIWYPDGTALPKTEEEKVPYIEADEDHICNQEKNGTEKRSNIVGKLLYLLKDRKKVDRKELKSTFYLWGFCSGGEASGYLFERMQEYIATNYESRYLNVVYIGGDVGAWIKAGTEDY